MTSLDYFFASQVPLDATSLLNALVIHFNVSPEIFERFSIDIFDKVTVMLVPVVFEENKVQMLMPGEDIFRIFAGIRPDPC